MIGTKEKSRALPDLICCEDHGAVGTNKSVSLMLFCFFDMIVLVSVLDALVSYCE